jgi:hypothetical protein
MPMSSDKLGGQKRCPIGKKTIPRQSMGTNDLRGATRSHWSHLWQRQFLDILARSLPGRCWEIRARGIGPDTSAWSDSLQRRIV